MNPMKAAAWRNPLRDPPFRFALLGGALFWLVLWLSVPTRPAKPAEVFSRGFLLLILFWPVVEELVFRGILQAELYRVSWARQSRFGISAANVLTSILFTLAHVPHHPPLWAAAVIVPSLIFGYFRDRTCAVYPSILLHVYYNLGYFLLTGLAQ